MQCATHYVLPLGNWNIFSMLEKISHIATNALIRSEWAKRNMWTVTLHDRPHRPSNASSFYTLHQHESPVCCYAGCGKVSMFVMFRKNFQEILDKKAEAAAAAPDTYEQFAVLTCLLRVSFGCGDKHGKHFNVCGILV